MGDLMPCYLKNVVQRTLLLVTWACNFLRYKRMTELMCERGLDNDVTGCNEINET
jgi:hypothetical protein